VNGFRGILAGALTLVAIHTLVAYSGPSQRLAELAGPNGIAVRIVEAFLSPDRPGIPERSAASVARGPGDGYKPLSNVAGAVSGAANNIRGAGGAAAGAALGQIPPPLPR
jgi:hypothetical protein